MKTDYSGIRDTFQGWVSCNLVERQRGMDSSACWPTLVPKLWMRDFLEYPRFC